MRMIRALIAALLVTGLGLSGLAVAPVSASIQQNRLVSTDPANFTPNVTNGRVLAVAQVGNTIVLGGTFTGVQKGGTTYTRSRIVAFDATTGAVSTTFNPTFSNKINALAPAADGTSVYVGGTFNQVNGVNRRKVVRLDVRTGAIVPGFAPGAVNGKVNDLKVSGGTVYIAGAFTKVAGQNRGRLASLDATTGALTAKLNLDVTGVNNGGGTAVLKIDVTPNGQRMVVIGNFSAVAGQTRRQVAMIDTSPATATLSSWSTDRFPNQCGRPFNTYMRDLDFSPDGTYFVLSTTGGYGGVNRLCDSITRWETGRTGGGQQPTWVDYTGGDTTYAVAITGTAVYAGGHFRWLNNPYTSDSAGPGAVPHQGIAALEPRTGLPFAWDGRRARGVGVFDMLATPTGLWLGSDTKTFGGEQRQRIAFLPLATGQDVPNPAVPQLPASVVRLGTDDSVSFTPMTAGGAPGTTTTVAGNDAFRQARGAFVLGSTLYTPWSNGTLRARTLTGTTLGAARTVNLYGGRFAQDAPNITGAFYDAATSRLYYTMSGGSQLYWRWFNPENELVGAIRYDVAPGALPVSQVRGMFLSQGSLYYARSDNGFLYRVGFASGTPGNPGAGVTGSQVLVDSSRSWAGSGLTLR